MNEDTISAESSLVADPLFESDNILDDQSENSLVFLTGTDDLTIRNNRVMHLLESLPMPGINLFHQEEASQTASDGELSSDDDTKVQLNPIYFKGHPRWLSEINDNMTEHIGKRVKKLGMGMLSILIYIRLSKIFVDDP